MSATVRTIEVCTHGRGMYEITPQLELLIAASGIREGLAAVLCRHTSASLVLMENADPDARTDLQRWLDRLVPANDPDFEHTLEGPDDMPAHIKTALTRSSEAIPVSGGRPALGTWQGLYLWEHRNAPHTRTLVVSVVG
jgi:secondary thiamine-phosphate synthase enzyme